MFKTIPAALADQWRELQGQFDAEEHRALVLPSSLMHTASPDAPSLLTLRDESCEWNGGVAPLVEWQQRVFEHAARIDPFIRWTRDRTLDLYRGRLQRLDGFQDTSEVARLPDITHRAIRRARNAGLPTPVDMRGTNVEAWLSEPVGQLRRVNRYLHELWLGRPDLHGLYPRVGDNDAASAAFLEWIVDRGEAEYDIPAGCMPTPQQLEARVHSLLPSARGVRIVGHLDATLGIGESARRMEAALGHAGVAVQRWDAGSEQDGRSFDVNLLCINAAEVATFAADVGEAFFEHRYTIGMWYWELPSKPDGLDAAMPWIDEIWVASEFVAAAIRPHVAVPVTVVPLPVRTPSPDRGADVLGQYRSAFTYGYIFDFNSTTERKNPIGLVQAYVSAFPTQDGATALVLKSINSHAHPEARAEVLKAIDGRRDIHFLEEHMSAGDRDALIASLDCYVSLHRSEGFGLTIAEALLLGVPTIATGYGANVEFAGEGRASLVDFSMQDVASTSGPYASGGTWADPDLEHAALLMREVRDNIDRERKRAARAGAEIAREHALERSSAFVTNRLQHIWEEHPLIEPSPPPRDPIAHLERHLDVGPSLSWDSGAGGLRGWMRGATRRLLQPYTLRQAEFERDVVTSLRQLRTDVDELRARRR